MVDPLFLSLMRGVLFEAQGKLPNGGSIAKQLSLECEIREMTRADNCRARFVIG
jgi:hypothetical protein